MTLLLYRGVRVTSSFAEDERGRRPPQVANVDLEVASGGLELVVPEKLLDIAPSVQRQLPFPLSDN